LGAERFSREMSDTDNKIHQQKLNKELADENADQHESDLDFEP